MNKYYLLSGISLLLIAAGLSVWTNLNHSLFAMINSALPWKTFWMTLTNSADGLCAGSLLFICLRNNLRLLACGIVAGLAVHLSTQYGKHFFAIPRPEHVNDLPYLITLGPKLGIHNYAMPSGHTATAFMLAMLLIKCYSLKSWKLLLMFFAAALIGISRIAVGAHWPADVFAGAAMGILIGHWCSHEKLTFQHLGFKYIAYIIYLAFIVLSIKRITHIHSVSHAISNGVIVLAGVIALVLWIDKMIQELNHWNKKVDDSDITQPSR